MKGMNIMYDYRGKVAGMIITGVSLVALIVQKFTHFTVINNYDSDQHFNFLFALTIMGLFTIMFSKEKMEDERVQQIRTKALMYAFMIMASTMIAFAFTMTTMPSKHPEMANGTTLTRLDLIENARLLMFYPAMGIALYLAIFHIGVYADDFWDYENKTWSWKDMFRYSRYRLTIVVIGIVVMLALFALMV